MKTTTRACNDCIFLQREPGARPNLCLHPANQVLYADLFRFRLGAARAGTACGEEARFFRPRSNSLRARLRIAIAFVLGRGDREEPVSEQLVRIPEQMPDWRDA